MGRNFKKGPFRARNNNALLLLFLILVGSFSYLFYINNFQLDREHIPFSTFLSEVDKGNVRSVVMLDQHIIGDLKDGLVVKRDGIVRKVTHFDTNVVSSDHIWQRLHQKQVQIDVIPPEKQNWNTFLFLMITTIILGVLFFLYMRQVGMQGGSGGKIFNVGKSRARFFMPNTIKVKFKNVAGVLEAKEDLGDVVEFLKSPEKFKKIGARIPRGILLTGAPGNGKTMLAKAVAGEASCPFFSVSGSDFVEVFVGVGASRVRDLFLQARKHSPCIVFVDEIDAVGRHRGVGIGGGNDEREQTLNQLLSEMDGFSSEPGEVIVIAATNRPDVLDKALLRPGRFDRKIEVPYPDLVSREQILGIHAKGVKLSDNVNLKIISRGTAGFSGADLANLVNEAALIASKHNKTQVDMVDFEGARDKILVGAERKTLTRTQEELARTAYHEAGHTLAMVFSQDAPPLHKVTILPRGGALGITWYLPEGDEVSKSESQMLAQIEVCLGGRVAEELIYGVEKRTSGALNDIRVASRIARDMVCLYGMSDLGPLAFEKQEGSREYSEAMAQKLDVEVSRVINKCYENVKNLIGKNKEHLEKLATTLLDKETLDGGEVYELLGLPERESVSFVKKVDEHSQHSKKPIQDEGDESLTVVDDTTGA